ncbi:MAG TPA: PAS domain S-box protein, partial [Polyangia bacterium]|nr:PAS domain S-box protein [Polyangia bacterium]
SQQLDNGSLLAIARELGPRRAAEQQLATSEAQLRSILQTAPDVIMAVDRRGTILFINRTLPPLSPEQVVGTNCFDYVPPDARERVEAALDHVFSTRTIDEYETRGPPDPDGVRVWSSVRAGPWVEGDQVIAAILCATDVTARRLEEERLRELAARLQRISDQIPGVVFQHRTLPDGKSHFLFIGDQIRDLAGVTPDDLRQDATLGAALIHPDDREALGRSLMESSRNVRPRHDEHRIVRADGQMRWIETIAVPEAEADGSVLWTGYTHDITARKDAERQRLELEEHLRQAQKVESIGKLAGGVAHDFNNLLTSVLGFLDLARGEVAADSLVAEYLTGALQAAERGAVLTQQLLAFARKKIVRPTALDLNETLQRMASMLRRLVGEELTLALSLSPTHEIVKVDPGSLEQVIMNLVVNARDAIQGAGRITLQTRHVTLDDDACRRLPDLTAGDYVTLSVSDTGTGMVPDVVARLFEPFFTTKPVGQGTGLGLAMCHGIVRQAGGTIAVESQFGAGSVFRVYLPRATDAVETETAKADLGPRARGRETLLLVEDEPTILRMASTALRALGYRVLTAADGVEAIEIIQNAADVVHLVFTDVVMPRMGGAELAARARDLRPGIRVLFSSGHTEDSIVEHGILQAGVDFLQKPYTPALLARKLRELLDRDAP